jgi:hypothetical protein
MFGKTAIGTLGFVLACILGAGAAIALCVNGTPSTTVCPSGCDYTTISAAVNAESNGCDILVGPGEYNEPTARINGKSDLRILAATATTTCSDPSRPVIISSDSTQYHAFKIENSDNVTIYGLGLTGWPREAIFVCGRLRTSTLDCKGNTNVIIENNCIHDNGSRDSSGGIFIARTNPGTHVEGNHIWNNGRNGIQLESDQTGSALDPIYIDNNIIRLNAWNGVSVGPMITTAEPLEHKVKFTNNYVCDNGTAPGTTGGRYGLLYGASNYGRPLLDNNLSLKNNLFFANKGQTTPSSSQDIGNWTQACTLGDEEDNLTTTATENTCDVDVSTRPLPECPPPLIALSPAKVWIAKTPSLVLDLRAEVFLASTKIGDGQLNNVSGGGLDLSFNSAVLRTIPLALTDPVDVPPGALLEIAVSARRTCFGAGIAAGYARLWFNGRFVDTGANRDAGSRFDVTINPTNTDYFLRDGFALDPTPGASKTSIDKLVDSTAPCPGRPFEPFGTWSTTLP